MKLGGLAPLGKPSGGLSSLGGLPSLGGLGRPKNALGGLPSLGSSKPLASSAPLSKPKPADVKPPRAPKTTDKSKPRVQPKRLAVKFKPPTIALEYEDTKHNKSRLKSFPIDLSLGVDAVVDKLTKSSYFKDGPVSKAQLRRLVQKLQNPPKPKAASPPKRAPAEVFHMPGQEPEAAADDYNNLTEEEREAKCKEMNASFKPIRKGDPGYVYEKDVEFVPAEGPNEWDDDEEDEYNDDDYEAELAKYEQDQDDSLAFDNESVIPGNYETSQDDSSKAPEPKAASTASTTNSSSYYKVDDDGEDSEPFMEEDISDESISMDIGSDADDDF